MNIHKEAFPNEWRRKKLETLELRLTILRLIYTHAYQWQGYLYPIYLFLFCILSLRQFVFELKKNLSRMKSKRFKLYEWEGNVQGLDCMNNISNIRDIKLLFWITTSFYCRIDFALICILIIDQKKFISKFISYTYIKYTCRIWLKN